VTGTNEAERTRWNDVRWAAVWPKRERLTDAVVAYLLGAAALKPGERVLDIGCGGGRTSLASAHEVGPGGAVVGADLSAPLLELAEGRAREAEIANVGFVRVDMQTDRVPGAPFDVAISQFGVMFFDEPVTAFANIRSQLVPGGRIAFVCWQAVERNPWLFASKVAQFVPPPPPPAPGRSPSGPFSLADPEHTAGILTAAGFADVRDRQHEFTVDVPESSIKDADQLTAMGVPAARLAEAEALVASHLQQFVLTPEISRYPLAFQVFTARTL
jgi:SAM-dependent methyltransferase